MYVKRWCVALLTVLLLLATGLPGMAQSPEPAQSVPPIIYQFFDWGTDYQTTNPEYGPIGAVHMIQWRQVNPARGVYDWSQPDAALAREAEITVTLRTGEVISRPVVLRLDFYLTRAEAGMCEGTDFWDGTPQWVYGANSPTVCNRRTGHVLESCGKKAVLPAFDSPEWREAYFDMVRALGEHYKDNPQIVAVQITTGIDGETQLVKRLGDCDWPAQARSVGGLEYRFQQFVLQAMQVYREAFPRTLVMVSNAPGIRQLTAERAAELTPPVAMHHAGMWTDAQNHEGIGGEVGTWDMYRVYSQTVPIWVESAYGFGTPEHFYWGWLAGLHYHPVAADVHEEWITQSDPAWLRFVGAHLGRTLADTPDVWAVLRDREYEPLTWGKSGHSGHNGDWTFWLDRTSDNPRVWREEMPEAAQGSIYARQARRVDAAHPLTVQVVPRVWFAGKPSWVRVISFGTLSLRGYPGAARDLGDGWTETTWTGVAADTITLAGDAYVHRVLVEPMPTAGPEPAPTVAPTPTPRPVVEEVRDAAWQAGGVPFNPAAAFPAYAREHKLGNPVTGEFDFCVGGVAYRGQGFSGGVVYCVVGDWGNVRHIAW